MKFYLFLFLLLGLLSACDSNQSINKFEPQFIESDSSLFKIKSDQEFTFGYLEVPENRQKTNNKTIKLPVYIFKSRNPNPSKDPIIYTVGGPGSSTMPSAQYMQYYKYLDDRDFILVEQRGTYYAQPHLACPEWSNAVYLSNLPGFDENKSDSLFAKAVFDCRQKLVEKGIDLDAYHTNEIAADIEGLRKALGIEQYNLLTISYSTKIAQILMRDYPEGIRSVVMDSPLPLEVNYDQESVANLIASLEKILNTCERNNKCNESYPKLQERFFNYLAEKNLKPLEVIVDHPEKGTPEKFHLRGKDLIGFFSGLSSSEVGSVPLRINQLLNNDLNILKEQLTVFFEPPGKGAGIGMRLSVWCAEELPFVDAEIIVEESNKYEATKGLSPAVFDPEICNIWSVEKMDDIENKPVKSNIPVLLISGEYDNETPPKWAAAMQKNLTNSHHIIFKGWTHTPTTNWGNPCAMTMANSFFNQPNQKPDNNCFTEASNLKFAIE